MSQQPYVRIISWNLRHTALRRGARVSLLRDLDDRFGRWDVLCAQEVIPELASALLDAFDGQRAHFIDRPGEREEGATSAALLLARAPWTLSGADVLSEAPSPLRSCTATLLYAGEAVAAVASGALPPARMPRWGVDAKVAQAEAFARWVKRQAPRPVIVGLDANGPLEDGFDGPTFHSQRERVLFGFPDAPLTDAYRAALSDADRERFRSLRPDGPLAVTYVAGGAGRRYDHILIRGCEVVSAGHVLGDALAAGSDHALVHALLRLPQNDQPAREHAAYR